METDEAMTTTELEEAVLQLAAEEIGTAVNRESRIDAMFNDSLEYLEFTLKLGELGHLSDEAISQAETLGDLIDAIVHPN